MSRRISILTTFYEATSGYSLIAVAENQIRMLLDHGYDPVVLCQEGVRFESGLAAFEEQPPPSVWNRKVCDLRPVLPGLHLIDGVHPQFEERVSEILDVLREHLRGVDTVITHDIILQKTYKEHNIAMRRYAHERPDITWLHWIHSQPDGYHPNAIYPEDCRYTPPPGYIVYPNESRKPIVCRTYQLSGQEYRVKVHRHSIDPMLLWPYDTMTKTLAVAAGFDTGDVNAIYPVRLDRGKATEKAIRLMAGVQSLGFDARLLVADWQSAAQRFQTYIDELEALAAELGVKVSFASRLDNRCKQGIPRQNVIELMDLCNVYIHPSQAETYSLVVHEAMLRGCLCILNGDLDVLRELYNNTAIYMDFGLDRVFHNHLGEPVDEQLFWNEEAIRLMAEMEQNRALWAKRRAWKDWSPQKAWPEFAQLLYLEPVQ